MLSKDKLTSMNIESIHPLVIQEYLSLPKNVAIWIF